MAARFQDELSRLPRTYQEALSRSIDALCTALSELSARELIAVGSGGSFTTALFMAELHERITGRLARAVTPLEFISKPGLADGKAVFLLSAEGKNTDILEALYACRLANGAAINAITNAESSELAERVHVARGNAFAFPISGGKDGYLATNTLFANIVLITRAYSALDPALDLSLPARLADFAVGKSSLEWWSHNELTNFRSPLRYPTISIVYDPELKAAVVDFESKLIEAGITSAHVADLRNFAHGRHFWLARHGDTTATFAFIGDRCIDLWQGIRDLLPQTLAVETLHFPGPFPLNTIAAVAAIMQLIKVAGEERGFDPGRPNVPPFGRSIYHTSIHKLVTSFYLTRRPRDEVQLKQNVLAHSSAAAPNDFLIGAVAAFQKRLAQQQFRAVVFDYDGTLCDTNRRFEPPIPELLAELSKLAESGIRVGIASGRGRSLYEQLRKLIEDRVWDRFVLGLYNGGHIIELAEVYQEPCSTPDPLLDDARRLIEELIRLGVPIARFSFKPHQISITPVPGVDAERLWFVVADALRRMNLPVLAVVRSGHSVDILGSGVSKSAIVPYLQASSGIAQSAILSIGDQGAWPGNDYALLEQPNSLSVDLPSRDPESGWKLAPSHLHGVDAALWYLRRIRVKDGVFTIDLRMP